MMTKAEYAVTIGNLFALGIVGMPFTAPLVSALLRRWAYPLSFKLIFFRAVFGAGFAYLIANALLGHPEGLGALMIVFLPTAFVLRREDFEGRPHATSGL
jgi:hypothetical protein